MTAPDQSGTGPAADAAATVQAIKDNAQRLGLTWTVRPALVTSSGTMPSAVFDGDSEPIPMTSMIGPLFPGQRVYVMIVPPSANYIVGFTAAPTGAAGLYVDRQTTIATVASVDFVVPSDLRQLRLSWRARCTSAGPFEQIHATVNGVLTNYFTEYQQAFGASPTAALLGANPWMFLGHVAGNGATAGVFGAGHVEFEGWDIGGSFLSFTFSSGALVSNGIWNGGSGVCSVTSPYTRLSIFPDAGASWVIGSDFQLEGVPT